MSGTQFLINIEQACEQQIDFNLNIYTSGKKERKNETTVGILQVDSFIQGSRSSITIRSYFLLIN